MSHQPKFFPFSLVIASGVVAAAWSGCSPRGEPTTEAPGGDVRAEGAIVAAVAELQAKSQSSVRGTVRFVRDTDGVRVMADITGLTPGEHGFHVHEVGDCSAPDATSAGDHFNPTQQPHAGRDAERRHVGDLGNLEAGADGRARLNYVDRKISLDGPHSIVGRSVVVHAGRDDGSTQPSGGSGDRIACGEIRAE